MVQGLGFRVSGFGVWVFGFRESWIQNGWLRAQSPCDKGLKFLRE